MDMGLNGFNWIVPVFIWLSAIAGSVR